MPRRRSYFFKYMTMFFLGASAVMLATYAAGTLDISTSLENAVQYIQQIVLTSDGTNSGTTGVIIDGAGKIGIGTDSPTAQLQIDGNNSGGTVSLGEIVPGFPNLYVPNIRLKADRNIFTGGLFISDYGGFFGVIKSILMPLLFTTSDGSRPDLVIATGGNVGIGTGGDAVYQANIYDSLQISRVGSNTHGNLYTNNGIFETWLGKRKDENNSGSGSPANYGLLIHALSSEMVGLRVSMQGLSAKAAIFEGGNVGIGTATPNNKLEIANTNLSIGLDVNNSMPRISFNSNKSVLSGFSIMQYGSEGYLWNQDGGISIQAGGNFLDEPNMVYISSTGQVGMGTINPSTKLDVQGGIRISGNRDSAYTVLTPSPGSPENNHNGVSDQCACDISSTNDCNGYASGSSDGCYDEVGPNFYVYNVIYSSSGCNLPGSIVYENGLFYGCQKILPGVSDVLLWKAL